MKQLYKFLALTLVAEPAAAQGVSVYGIVDTGAEYVSNVGASGSRLVRMPNITGTTGSRLGFRGSEALGDELYAVFVLESGMGVDTGSLNQGGRMFGRQSFVGFKSPWGAVAFGRQYSFLTKALVEADIMGPNVYGSGSLDAFLPNARADNSFTYAFDVNGWSGGAQYSLGRDTVAGCPGESSTNACREWSAALRFDNASWGGAAVAYDKQRGGPGAAGGLTLETLTDTRAALTAYVRTGALTIGAGVINRDNQGAAVLRKSNLAWVGCSYKVFETWFLDAQYLTLDFKDSDAGSKLLVLRATYPLSKRTALYGTVARIDNDGTQALSVSAGGPGASPIAGRGQTGAMVGMRHTF